MSASRGAVMDVSRTSPGGGPIAVNRFPAAVVIGGNKGGHRGENGNSAHVVDDVEGEMVEVVVQGIGKPKVEYVHAFRESRKPSNGSHHLQIEPFFVLIKFIRRMNQPVRRRNAPVRRATGFDRAAPGFIRHATDPDRLTIGADGGGIDLDRGR